MENFLVHQMPKPENMEGENGGPAKAPVVVQPRGMEKGCKYIPEGKDQVRLEGRRKMHFPPSAEVTKETKKMIFEKLDGGEHFSQMRFKRRGRRTDDL
jgi:hypothetical protein